MGVLWIKHLRKASKLRNPPEGFSPKADSSSPCVAKPFMALSYHESSRLIVGDIGNYRSSA